MGKYEVKIQGVTVEISVIDDEDVPYVKIAEFKSSLLQVGFLGFFEPKILNSRMASVVELSELAVRVLKKYSLSTCGLAELASEVGFVGTNALDNWKSIVFSIEEIKFAIHDAYTVYRVGDKLIRMGGSRGGLPKGQPPWVGDDEVEGVKETERTNKENLLVMREEKENIGQRI
ncbi:hypothetical protein Ddye_028095 [Dipteronia dyeriana]|uniref:Uncharacterized protein n=1 Tax=Dipteronia dyeriana TaxID=168575 RepID=A0AAD9TR87_9ROSI|nr:hypothetical protein Ddye_028095 [Dipteronia dyeriana]